MKHFVAIYERLAQYMETITGLIVILS